MSNKYLKKRIKYYNLWIPIIVIILIMCSAIAGRYFFFNSIFNIIIGAVLGVIGSVAMYLIEHFMRKRQLYEKGLKLEEDIAQKLKRLKIQYGEHLETKYGDLDLLVSKGDKFYGIEAKNWAGKVVFENNLLKVDNFDSTHVLKMLLQHCLLVRNKEFGENSHKFINPILVFGHKAVVEVKDNKILFNNIEIVVATIKDFDQFLK